jgi:hypothetical protein
MTGMEFVVTAGLGCMIAVLVRIRVLGSVIFLGNGDDFVLSWRGDIAQFAESTFGVVMTQPAQTNVSTNGYRFKFPLRRGRTHTANKGVDG